MTSIIFHSKSALRNDITQIIKGTPASALASLPAVWQELAQGQAQTGLTNEARLDYVEAAKVFRYHDTPLSREALHVIGCDFDMAAYLDLDACFDSAETELARSAITALKSLFAEFGYDVPAAFYTLMLETVSEDNPRISLKMFKNKDVLLQDRLWDAVLHAVLLVTPIGLYVQSVFSQHGVRFTHMMNCSCSMTLTSDAPFIVALDADLRTAYLQNVVAAAFEQYGVNAATSRNKRGF